MTEPLCSSDNVIDGVSATHINRVHDAFSNGIHFAKPVPSLRTNEVDVVRGVLQMLQGLSSSLFYWDPVEWTFRVKSGMYLTHLSKGSFHRNLDQFVYAATCLQLVEVVVEGIEKSTKAAPTLRAFANSVSMWLKWLRDIALKEEVKICKVDAVFTPTLLGLASSLSSLCSGAEHLLQIVNGAIPQDYFEPNFSVSNAEVAVHVLDYLYQRLDDISLVQGSQEEVCQRLLHIFVGSLLPYIECLDSWLYEGSVNDPFEELFFYANKAISIDATDFWDKSYLVRQPDIQKPEIKLYVHTHTIGDMALANEKKDLARKELSAMPTSTKEKNQSSNVQVCPLFLKDIARSIVSAGKSLQLIRHVPMTCAVIKPKKVEQGVERFRGYGHGNLSNIQQGQTVAGLSLSEVFCVSLAGLIGHGEHIFRNLWKDDDFKSDIASLFESRVKIQGRGREGGECLNVSEKLWWKFLVDTLKNRTLINSESTSKEAYDYHDASGESMDEYSKYMPLLGSFCPENPVITMCRTHLTKSKDYWKSLNISRNFFLPPLNDELLYKAIFSGDSESLSFSKGTNFTSGFQFCKSEFQRIQDATKTLEGLFPFPTLLPCFEDGLHISESLPAQKGSTLSSKVLNWLQNAELRTTPLPVVIMQECLIVYIKRQVDLIGRHMLSKLMTDWRLMDELAVLRAIYLLGSGDLLQHFLTVIFTKLDSRESWDDDFELNMILQESIRNSADSMLLSAPDSLEVSITKGHDVHDSEQHNFINVPSTPRKTQVSSFGIDGLSSLSFSYKVSWPLELIANTEALKKYNKVMGFLLKVKRAKFVLDKARRWIWKTRGTAATSRKCHWLLEQKLLHFVDAFHQYIMDRVYHSAWQELCEGMAVAGSLDEVMEVHEAYLLTIQRQCFVVPDKLGALVASRINSILGLALDFYSIQQTLSSGGAVSSTKSRCELEIDRIEKQFDDCIAFLLRVLSFRLNVGNFPHLADLVTRINYNYFYMSESGNLVTAPGSEIRSKLGKTFAGRRE